MNRFTIPTQDLSSNDSLQVTVPIQQRAWYQLIIKNLLVLFLPACLFSSQAFAQTTTTFPPASSCTSKDLLLTGAALPGTDLCNTCVTGDSVYRTLNLSIFNKTGSTRTAFAFWGTLVIRNSNGTISSTRSIQGCGGPVAKNATTTLLFNQIGYVCGQSLTIKDLFLAWTDASPNSTCASINSATINPKCGTLDSIQINTGLDASFSVTNATCATPGAIDMTPLGGKAPYTYSWVASEGGVIPSGQSTNQDLTGLVAGKYTVTITDALNCPSTRFTTVTASAPVTASAGDDFTKTCISNTSGKQIGAASEAGFTYSWSPATGLSNASVSNPTANPSSTTTYTVTKTNTSTGCSNTDQVTVTVNNTAVVANAGDDFTKSCSSNTSGKQIGAASEAGFTYSWSPATGLSNASVSNPTANPSSTTTYTITKTNTSSGCSNTDNVTVTVNTDAPGAPTICVVQPSLCGPATGSITILSPLGADYEYSIDNGASWQSGTEFNNLAAGSVTGIKVKYLSSGCISTAANCDASECSSAARLATTTSTQNETPTLTNGLNDLNVAENQTTVKAFPNPFSDHVKFVVTASEGGKGSLEVFNSLGQKVQTVFQGYIRSGANMFQVNLPSMKSAQLIYVLRVGNKHVTGKLLQLNQ
jgi:hypothetical protein